MSDEDLHSQTVIVAPGVARRLSGAPRARLTCSDRTVLKGGGGAQILLEATEITIGRGDENTVKLKADGVSRRHARIFPAGQAWHIEDAGSTNGVRVNGEDIQAVLLKNGDDVEIGVVSYTYTIDPQQDVDQEKSVMEFARGIPMGAERQTTASKTVSIGSNALLWSIVIIGAAALVFAIFTVVSV